MKRTEFWYHEPSVEGIQESYISAPGHAVSLDARLQVCLYMVSKFEVHGENFLDSVVTVDESWMPCFELDPKFQSSLWKHSDSQMLNTAIGRISANKTIIVIILFMTVVSQVIRKWPVRITAFFWDRGPIVIFERGWWRLYGLLSGQRTSSHCDWQKNVPHAFALSRTHAFWLLVNKFFYEVGIKVLSVAKIWTLMSQSRSGNLFDVWVKCWHRCCEDGVG